MRIDLPSGGWAELLDPSQIKERHRRPIGVKLSQVSPEANAEMRLIKQKMTEEGVTELNSLEMMRIMEKVTLSAQDIEYFSEANDLCVVAMVKAWSYSVDITVDNVLDLPSGDYDRLRDACVGATGTLFLDFGVSKNPNSPTPASNGSATPSEAVAASTSDSPPPSGEPTSSSEQAST